MVSIAVLSGFGVYLKPIKMGNNIGQHLEEAIILQSFGAQAGFRIGV